MYFLSLGLKGLKNHYHCEHRELRLDSRKGGGEGGGNLPPAQWPRPTSHMDLRQNEPRVSSRKPNTTVQSTSTITQPLDMRPPSPGLCLEFGLGLLGLGLALGVG